MFSVEVLQDSHLQSYSWGDLHVSNGECIKESTTFQWLVFQNKNRHMAVMLPYHSTFKPPSA
jgi:hypothetical protein